MILGRGTDNEGRYVNHLLADCNMSLEDQDTSVMDGLCESALHDESLETSFHELRDGQTKHIIELALRFFQETNPHHSSDESLT